MKQPLPSAGPMGKPAAKLTQRLTHVNGGCPIQRSRIVVTMNGRISEDTLASVRRLVRAGLV